MSDRITMKDVGKLAGVSRTTVDRVLKNKAGVSEASRKKIEKALKVLGYKVNKYARALKNSTFFKLAILLPEHKEESYYASVKCGIIEGFNTLSYPYKEYKVFVYNPKIDNSFDSVAKELIKYNPNAVILGPVGSLDSISAFINEIEKKKVDYIIMDSFAQNFNPVSFIGQNGNTSGRFLANLLYNSGFKKKIGIIKNNKNRTISQQEIERECGFIDFYTRVAPETIIKTIFINEEDDPTTTIIDFIDKNKDLTCIITFNSSIGYVSDVIKNTNSKIHLIGYDISSYNVQKLKDGDIDFLVCQSPTHQGLDAIKSIFNYVILKDIQEKMHYYPIYLIAKENLDYYLKFEESNKIL